MITERQHLALSLTSIKRVERLPKATLKTETHVVEYPRFTKPGEAQGAAVKRFNATMKRRAESGSFPKFVPGRTTTADYVLLFAAGRDALPIAGLSHHASHPAPFLTDEDDRVVVEIDDEVIYA
jgi:hypothetical protein